MAGRARLVQNSFAGGEVSPRMYGRTDTERYRAACKTLENFVLLRQGGVTRRPGTMFVAETKDSTRRATLIPFQFNDQQAYVVELGHLYARWFKDSGQVYVALTDATWNTTTNQITIGAPYRTIRHVIRFTVAGSVTLQIGSTSGGADIKAQATYAEGSHTVEFDPGGNATIYLTFGGTGTVTNQSVLSDQPVELVTPYAETEVAAVQYDQSADVMWIVHRQHKPRKLLRFGDASWSLVLYTPVADPFTSATNYPRAVALWKSRLWFGGTDAEPRKLWGSRIDDFENLDAGTGLDDEAVIRTVAGGQVNVIQWFVPSDKEMFIGTFGSEMRGMGDTNGVVTPKNFTIVPATAHGSAPTRPVVAANAVFFLQRSRQKLRQFAFDFNADKYRALELTTVADHIAGTGLGQLAYHEDPDPVLWSVRDDGQLVGLSYHPDEKLLGWHRHRTGIRADGTQAGWFEAVATIPHPDGTRDQTWVIVRRTINGATKRFVEYFNDNEGFYGRLNTDSTLIGTFGAPQSAVGGLDHLIGEEVDIVGDGAVYPRQVVDSLGRVTLDPPAQVIEVGLPYASTLTTLRPEPDAGTIQGAVVARDTIVVRVLDTVTIKINGQPIPDRSSEDPMDAPPLPVTGDLTAPVLGWDVDAGEVTVTQDLPLSATVLLIASNVTAGDS